MYAAVHARPDGESTVARMATTAHRYGYHGLVVRNHADADVEYDPHELAEAFGVDVVDGREVRAETRSKAGGYLGTYRPETTVLLVHGGDPTLNRFAVEQAQVDVLAHPMRGEGDLNHVLARRAAENGVSLEVDLSPVLRADGGRRVRAIGDLRKQRELIEQYDAPFVVSARPESHLEIRAPRELRAVGESIGFAPEQIDEGLAAWGRIAERTRERRSERYVEPGVRRGRPDHDEAGGADE